MIRIIQNVQDYLIALSLSYAMFSCKEILKKSIKKKTNINICIKCFFFFTKL